MNIISTLRKASEDRSQRAQEKQHDALTAHYTEAIQAKEFDGKLYIAVGGIPVLSTDELGADILTAIQHARQTAVAYSEKGGAR